MKIAFLVSTFPVISETFILDQITGLIDRNVDVDIYAIQPSLGSKKHPDHEYYNLHDRTYYQNKLFGYFPSVFFPNPPRRSFAIMNALNSIRYRIQLIGLQYVYKFIPILKNSYDIIHAHFGPHGVRGQLLKDLKIADGKLVTSFHGVDMVSYVQRFGIEFYKNLFEEGSLFLPISNFWKNQLIDWGCERNKIKVQHMGINLAAFKFNPKAINDTSTIHLLSVARLIEKKGLEYSIRAVANLVKQNLKMNYSIIGDGPLRNNLKSLINELGLKQHVHLLGQKNRSEVMTQLQTSDIFIAPSVTAKDGDMEGIPMVLMEAMAMGLPVISTFHSGIPELIQNEYTGFLTPEKDVDEISHKILQIINNPKPLDQIKENARNYVKIHFNLEKQNDKLLKIYQNLMS